MLTVAAEQVAVVGLHADDAVAAVLDGFAGGARWRRREHTGREPVRLEELRDRVEAALEVRL